MKDKWLIKTTKTRRSRAKRNPYNEVDHETLRRDIERGVEWFWSSKPWRERPVPVVGKSSRSLRGMMGLEEAVRVAVAIGEPMRGTFRRIVDANRLDYQAFMKAYYKAKKLAAAERRACA